jgi:hypothetical protein
MFGSIDFYGDVRRALLVVKKQHQSRGSHKRQIARSMYLGRSSIFGRLEREQEIEIVS